MIESCSNIGTCEQSLSSNVKKGCFIGEFPISDDDICKIEQFIVENLSSNYHDIVSLSRKYPCTLACFLVWEGILGYKKGDYWSRIEDITGYLNPNQKTNLGDSFLSFLKRNDLPYKDMKYAHKYVTNILFQGIIPNSCLNSFFSNMLIPLHKKEFFNYDFEEVKSFFRDWKKYESEIEEIENKIEDLKINKDYYLNELEEIETIISIWDTVIKLNNVESELNNQFNFNFLLDYKSPSKNQIVIEDLEYLKKEYLQDAKYFKLYDFTILNHSDLINKSYNIFLELDDKDKRLEALNNKLAIVEERLDKLSTELFYRTWNNQDIEYLKNLPFNQLKSDIEYYNKLVNDENDKLKSKNIAGIISLLKKKFSNNSFLNKFFYYGQKEKLDTYSNIFQLLEPLPIDKEKLENPETELVDNLNQFLAYHEDYNKHKGDIELINSQYEDSLADLKQISQNSHLGLNDYTRENISDLKQKLGKLQEYKDKTSSEKEKLDYVLDIIGKNFDFGNTQFDFLIKIDKIINVKKDLLNNYHGIDKLITKIEETDKSGYSKNYYLSKKDELDNTIKDIKSQVSELNRDLELKEKHFVYLDKPVRRFFLYGEEFAEKFLHESVLLLNNFVNGKYSKPKFFYLPPRIIDNFESWWNKYGKDHLERSKNNQSNDTVIKFKSPVIYLDDFDNLKVYLPSQYLIKEGFNPDNNYYLSIKPTDSEYGINQPLKIYDFSENLLETEEIDLSLDKISHFYEFKLLKDDDVIKTWDVKQNPDTKYTLYFFDYKSRRMIQNDTLPRNKVIIISDYGVGIYPNVALEKGNLRFGNDPYVYNTVNLNSVDDLFLVDEQENYERLPLSKKQPKKPKLTDLNILELATSNGNNIHFGSPPSIEINLDDHEEIENWKISIVNEENTDQQYHHRLDEINDILQFNIDGTCKIPLSSARFNDEPLFGNFKIRLKNKLLNVDETFNLCIVPHLDIKFNKSIFLPESIMNSKVVASIETSDKVTFKAKSPANKIGKTGNIYQIKTHNSRDVIQGYLKYQISSNSYIESPLEITVPKITWYIEGLPDKYSNVYTEKVEIPERILENSAVNNLQLTVNIPYDINGTSELSLSGTSQYVKSKIKNKSVTFKLSVFIDTIKSSANPLNVFKFSLLKSRDLKDITLFYVKKWHVKNIECSDRKQDGKHLFEISWSEEGYEDSKHLILWDLKYGSNVYEEELDDGIQSTSFEIDEDKLKPGRYLIHFGKGDGWEPIVFPGENALNTKEIYLNIKDTDIIEYAKRKFNNGDYKESILYYKRASESDKNLESSWSHKIYNSFIYMGEYKKAIDVYYYLLTNDSHLNDTDCSNISFGLINIAKNERYNNTLDIEDNINLLLLFSYILKHNSSFKRSALCIKDKKSILFKLIHGLQYRYPEKSIIIKDDFESGNYTEAFDTLYELAYDLGTGNPLTMQIVNSSSPESN
ncbi:hypothetical protein Metev_1205 [Methanohalobium evestigatum Z-7303]|uniref:Uncharacterized protein n=1 Tax=Methanohalobium evestigatum (strain ATCC BAA-1072 / DSM 3721 / NBRC 107634 / OCM 161 / Z-7303) TaxID=644295 RepID=D7E7K7_METEZ|nr:hypothetical protein [Methanohalobium evestigatum]ADI74080.1 hypothetical protein Metev_1205 [Methanohalobium evestigatum Z-7303]